MLADEFQRATLAHQQGRIEEAEALCGSILEADPRHAGALFLAGLTALQSGRTHSAVDLLSRSVASDPTQPYAHLNLGAALLYLERPHEALASFDRALDLAPADAMAHNNRATALLDLGRPTDALASLDRALQLQPHFAGALCNRGDTLVMLGRPQDALASYAEAIRLKPDYVDAFNSHGRALLSLQQAAQAAASFEHALRLQPDLAEAHHNRGNALVALNQFEDAAGSYRRAVQLQPGYPEALNNLGSTLLLLRRTKEALASFDRALLLKPDFAPALSNRGYILRGLKQQEEAAACFAKLLAVAPDYDYALGALCHARLMCCDWTQHAQHVEQICESVRAGARADSPLSFLAVSDSAQAQLRCARSYAAQQFPASPTALWRGERYRHDRPRIAYLSADFHEHATSHLVAGLFERHDRKRFETIAISFGPDDGSPMRARLRCAFDRFIDVRALPDRTVAELLRSQEIDIAVDLKGLTQDCRTNILAARPAPIQVNYLGYPGTMGASYIDYILADMHVIPESHRAHYSESVVYLPECYQVNDSRRIIAGHTPTRAQAGLPAQAFVFCCFNNSYKITPAVFEIWMRLLKGVPHSVLWLFEDNASVARNLRTEAARSGLPPERLVFARRLPLSEHLARHRLADLFLDTLPVNAHTTASDALWAGLPVLTCMGNAFAARVAGSLLHAIGLPDLVTDTPNDYERTALELATTPALLAAIRSRLARNRETHALFNTDRFRRHLESAYETMFERYQCGQGPTSFTVQPAP